jgi:hypothetical protein
MHLYAQPHRPTISHRRPRGSGSGYSQRANHLPTAAYLADRIEVAPSHRKWRMPPINIFWVEGEAQITQPEQVADYLVPEAINYEESRVPVASTYNF